MRKLTDTYGIAEVINSDDGAYYTEAWWWCRYHFRPELGSWTQMNCVRIGPFMSEGEALNCGISLHGEKKVEAHRE